MSAGSSRSEAGGAQLPLGGDFGAAAASSAAAEMTIGAVLEQLRADFPDLTISKIRYYERQGLLAPARTAAGYRKFTAADVSRLHWVLTAARDQYLPLKVIKERLRAAGGVLTPAAAGPTGFSEAAPDVTDLPVAAEQPPGTGPGLFSFAASERRLTRRELLRESGLTDEQLTELEAYGLVAARGVGSSYEAEALTVARIVGELGQYGFQARHLRPVKAAVDREVGLIEQTLTPLVRQPSREGRRRAEERARGYAVLSVRLHVALLEGALRAALR